MTNPVCFHFEMINKQISSFSGSLDGESISTETICTEQKAYLFRTNYHLFNCAVQLIMDKGLKDVGFIGVRRKMKSIERQSVLLGQKCVRFREDSRYFLPLA